MKLSEGSIFKPKIGLKRKKLKLHAIIDNRPETQNFKKEPLFSCKIGNSSLQGIKVTDISSKIKSYQDKQNKL